MAFHTKVTEDQIIEQVDLASEGIEEGPRWPSMSYEEGVRHALDWVLGNEDSAPMEDD